MTLRFVYLNNGSKFRHHENVIFPAATGINLKILFSENKHYLQIVQSVNTFLMTIIDPCTALDKMAITFRGQKP